jgi:hypothetical protein
MSKYPQHQIFSECRVGYYFKNENSFATFHYPALIRERLADYLKGSIFGWLNKRLICF